MLHEDDLLIECDNLSVIKSFTYSTYLAGHRIEAVRAQLRLLPKVTVMVHPFECS